MTTTHHRILHCAGADRGLRVVGFDFLLVVSQQTRSCEYVVGKGNFYPSCASPEPHGKYVWFGRDCKLVLFPLEGAELAIYARKSFGKLRWISCSVYMYLSQLLRGTPSAACAAARCFSTGSCQRASAGKLWTMNPFLRTWARWVCGGVSRESGVK